jgi:hypothetical protein
VVYRLNSDLSSCGGDGGSGRGFGDDGQQVELERLARSRTAPAGEVRQVKALLWAAAEGAAAVGVNASGSFTPPTNGPLPDSCLSC